MAIRNRSQLVAIIFFLASLFGLSQASAQTVKFDQLALDSEPNGYFFDRDKFFDERLKRFIQQLKIERANVHVHLVHYKARVSTVSYDRPSQLADRAKWEIVNRTKIKDENVFTHDGGLRDQDTLEFWIARKGGESPPISPAYGSTEAVVCPAIYLNDQDFHLDDKTPARFGASLYPKAEASYEWTVSAGRILNENAGAAQISVDVRNVKTLLVTVRVPDLPAECTRERTIRTEIGLRPILFDEYGRIPESEIRARMDAYLNEIFQNPNMTGYMILYGERSRPATLNLMERLYKNHVLFRSFSPERIIFVRGGYREQVLTEMWLVPRGSRIPTPRPSVDSSFVTKPTAKPRRRK